MMTSNVELITEIEQFYYREARLLDERCFQQWLALVDESIEYSMPTRFVPHPNPKEQGTEAYLSVEHELDRGVFDKGSPIRQDYYPHLMVRAMRPYSNTAWSESPAPRTRRSITNVEVVDAEDDRYTVCSNFQMYYSHRGNDNHLFTGGRRDLLKRIGDSFKIFRREVVIDWDVVTGPTLALIF